MNTTVFESNEKLNIAESYYKAMLEKDFEQMAQFLHDTVHYIDPSAEIHGKEAVVLAAKGFGEILQDIQIRSRFSSGNQIMLAYDVLLPEPIGTLRASVLMEYTNQLISKIELFYDTKPFDAWKQ